MPLKRWQPLRPEKAPHTQSQGGLPLLDEVVFDQVRVHIEQMNPQYYWMGITEPDGETLHFGFELQAGCIDFAFAWDSPDAAFPPLPITPAPADQQPAAANDPEAEPQPQVCWTVTGPATMNPQTLAAILAGFGCRLESGSQPAPRPEPDPAPPSLPKAGAPPAPAE